MGTDDKLQKLKRWAGEQAKQHYENEMRAKVAGVGEIQEVHSMTRMSYESVIEKIRSLENDEVQDRDDN